MQPNQYRGLRYLCHALRLTLHSRLERYCVRHARQASHREYDVMGFMPPWRFRFIAKLEYWLRVKPPVVSVDAVPSNPLGALPVPEYVSSPQEQLDYWVLGYSLHNQVNDECCPDFSCCQPDLQWPRDKREAFAKAHREGDDRTRDEMLASSLAALVKANFNQRGKLQVHVAGTEEGDPSNGQT